MTRRTNDHVQLVQSFAADVSHELKNPLASIRTAAEMMAACESEADRRRFLELMTKDVARLERLVSGSRERIVQVFDNIIANAVSLSPEGSTVEIVARAGDNGCVVTVEDRGPGIPAAHIERIFDRFLSYRPGQERREHIGLGLAIARQIVESYGGMITARNRQGGGTRIQVDFPAAASAPARHRA